MSSKELELDTIVTTYSSRYTFANIAKQLGYSNELISEALGHSYGNRTTGIYLGAFDTKVNTSSGTATGQGPALPEPGQ